jgi:diguanylate cyclase (GGDEF)-like protein/PAS domain S-box-containing protein
MPVRIGSSERKQRATVAGADNVAAATLRELPEALILVFDRELRFVLTAGHALGRVANPPPDLEGKPVGSTFPEAVWKLLEPLFRSALAGETRSREIHTRDRTADQQHCLMVDVGPLSLDGSGAGPAGVAGGVAVLLDVTARRREVTPAAGASAAGKDPGGGFEEVFERAPIGTALLDLDGRWLLVNRALCAITGYTSEELVGKHFDRIVHPDDLEIDLDQRRSLLAGEVPAFQIEKRYFDAAGELVSAILSVSLVRDRDGAPLHFIAQLQDISERKRLEEQLRHLADHDPLTGLRNRRLFEHDLELQVARSRRYGETAGLMMIDLDDFKTVNDRYGHKVGDETLKAVARALTRRLRETDLVARFGGDEFAVLLPHSTAENVGVVADGLERVLPACGVDVGEDVLHPSASIGFAIIDQGTESAERVFDDADQAIYAAKRARTR